MGKNNFGGSLLPSSDPRILKPIETAHGSFRVVPLEDLEIHLLVFDYKASGRYPASSTVLTGHANGYSCHALAERIIAAWDGKRPAEYAVDQLSHNLDCGGIGIKLDSMCRWIEIYDPKHERN